MISGHLRPLLLAVVVMIVAMSLTAGVVAGGQPAGDRDGVVCSLDWTDGPTVASPMVYAAGVASQEDPCAEIGAASRAQLEYMDRLRVEIGELGDKKAEFVREYVKQCIAAGGGAMACAAEANELADQQFDPQIDAVQGTFDAEAAHHRNVIIPELRRCTNARVAGEPFVPSIDLNPRDPTVVDTGAYDEPSLQVDPSVTPSGPVVTYDPASGPIKGSVSESVGLPADESDEAAVPPVGDAPTDPTVDSVDADQGGALGETQRADTTQGDDGTLTPVEAAGVGAGAVLLYNAIQGGRYVARRRRRPLVTTDMVPNTQPTIGVADPDVVETVAERNERRVVAEETRREVAGSIGDVTRATNEVVSKAENAVDVSEDAAAIISMGRTGKHSGVAGGNRMPVNTRWTRTSQSVRRLTTKYGRYLKPLKRIPFIRPVGSALDVIEIAATAAEEGGFKNKTKRAVLRWAITTLATIGVLAAAPALIAGLGIVSGILVTAGLGLAVGGAAEWGASWLGEVLFK